MQDRLPLTQVEIGRSYALNDGFTSSFRWDIGEVFTVLSVTGYVIKIAYVNSSYEKLMDTVDLENPDYQEIKATLVFLNCKYANSNTNRDLRWIREAIGKSIPLK